MSTDQPKKKRWTATRKRDLILESLKGTQSVAELCRTHGISQSQFYEWRDQFLTAGEEGFKNNGKSARIKEYENRIDQLEKKLGQTTLECEILKKADALVKQRQKKSKD